jgi:hypothetical protein
MTQDANNYHVSYPDVFRQWSPACEKYAGGDSLVTALTHGWDFSTKTIFYEEFWLAGTRPVVVFHFQLEKGDVAMTMPVITNPYVRRVIRMHEITAKPMVEKDKSEKRTKDADVA